MSNGEVLFNSSVTAEGQTVPFNTDVSLKAGNTVVFSAGPDGGLQNTGLSATVTLLPEPNTCAIGSGRNRCRGNNLAEEKDLKRPKGKNSMTGGATAQPPGRGYLATTFGKNTLPQQKPTRSPKERKRGQPFHTDLQRTDFPGNRNCFSPKRSEIRLL